jgi:hypothetical protein
VAVNVANVVAVNKALAGGDDQQRDVKGVSDTKEGWVVQPSPVQD